MTITIIIIFIMITVIIIVIMIIIIVLLKIIFVKPASWDMSQTLCKQADLLAGLFA